MRDLQHGREDQQQPDPPVDLGPAQRREEGQDGQEEAPRSRALDAVAGTRRVLRSHRGPRASLGPQGPFGRALAVQDGGAIGCIWMCQGLQEHLLARFGSVGTGWSSSLV